MRRRVVVALVTLVVLVLLLVEVPLAVTFARRERDGLAADVERDATSLAALAEEVIEDPGQHDVTALARRFGAGTDGGVVVIEARGQQSEVGDDESLTPSLASALDQARQGHSTTGRSGGQAFAAVPLGSGPDVHGAVLVSHSDAATERRIHQLWLALGVIAAVVLGVAVLVGDRLARWATDPLRRLGERAAALGRGDLAARADDGSGPPEFVDLARTFNDMAARLEALVGAQQRFVADASHQLRSPLTALRLRLDAVDLSDPAGAGADIAAATTETMRLSRLVDGLLALIRADDAGAGAERHPVDVVAAVAQRRGAWSALADERGVQLRTDLPDQPVEVPLVDGHLEQILDNLIDNAVDVTEAGRSVTLAVRPVAGAVEIQVVDEGPGMSPDELAHAFERFWQGSHGARSGSGLGLPIVAQLAAQNGGTAHLATPSHPGTTATITFPRPPP